MAAADGESRKHLTSPQTVMVTTWMIRNWERFKASPVTKEEYIALARAETGIENITEGKLYHIARSGGMALVEVIKGMRPPRPARQDDRLRFIARQLLTLINAAVEQWQDKVEWSAFDITTLKEIANEPDSPDGKLFDEPPEGSPA